MGSPLEPASSTTSLRDAGRPPTASTRTSYFRGGARKLVRSLQRRSGQAYEREWRWTAWGARTTRWGGAGAPQRDRRRSAQDGAIVMELSEETYTYDASRDWAVSKQTMQVVDNRVETEVALNRRLGALRDVSYQLFRGSEILESAFEQRDDRLCVVRQLSELLRLPRRSILGLRRHLSQELGAQGRHRARDPGVLRRAALHRELLRADARLLRAARQGAAARGLLHLPRPRLLLPQRRRRVLL